MLMVLEVIVEDPRKVRIRGYWAVVVMVVVVMGLVRTGMMLLGLVMVTGHEERKDGGGIRLS